MLDFVRLAVGAVALFLLPGYALLTLGRRQLSLDWVEAFCLASGLSLAAVPIFLYATTLLGLTQGTGVVWGLLAICALVITGAWWRGRKHPSPSVSDDLANDPEKRWVYGALAIVLLFTLIGRLWSVVGVHFPAWTDSYGHAVITQMVIDQGMIPTTYAPYAPIDDFTYHFGLHALAAWIHWITGATVLYSLVIVGQILNVLVVPTTYLFVQRVFNRRIAGLGAAVVVGLLSHMPAQFVNWGRFTQLDGQMLLPIAVLLYWALLQTPAPRSGLAGYRLLLLTVAAFVGLFFVHYRIFIFGVFLAAILWGWAMIRPMAGQKRGRLLWEASLLALCGMIVLAPWLWRLAKGFGGDYATAMVSGYEEEMYGSYYGFAPRELLDFGVHSYLWGLAGAGALWGLWRRNGMVVAILLWVGSTFAAANLHFLNFTPLYSNTIVILALYLPVAALIGYLVQEVATVVSRRWRVTSVARLHLTRGLMIGLVLLGIGAAVSHVRLVERDNIFVRDADLAAMRWIEQEIPADALFYIAASFWTPTVAHGLDGGYYLPLLAARQTIMPPQHYASDGTYEFRNLVNQRLRDLTAAAENVEKLWTTLNRYGITHIYIGARPTGLDPQFFLERPDLFAPLYDQEGVWVFEVNQPGA